MASSANWYESTFPISPLLPSERRNERSGGFRVEILVHFPSFHFFPPFLFSFLPLFRLRRQATLFTLPQSVFRIPRYLIGYSHDRPTPWFSVLYLRAGSQISSLSAVSGPYIIHGRYASQPASLLISSKKYKRRTIRKKCKSVFTENILWYMSI